MRKLAIIAMLTLAGCMIEARSIPPDKPASQAAQPPDNVERPLDCFYANNKAICKTR